MNTSSVTLEELVIGIQILTDSIGFQCISAEFYWIPLGFIGIIPKSIDESPEPRFSLQLKIRIIRIENFNWKCQS